MRTKRNGSGGGELLEAMPHAGGVGRGGKGGEDGMDWAGW